MSPSGSRQVLDAIGNTPLVELRRVVPAGSARIIAKLESANPTGSMKDRVAPPVATRHTSCSPMRSAMRNVGRCGRTVRSSPTS